MDSLTHCLNIYQVQTTFQALKLDTGDKKCCEITPALLVWDRISHEYSHLTEQGDETTVGSVNQTCWLCMW